MTDYREKLAGVLAVRTEVEENISKLRDALYDSTGAEAEREAQREKLQEDLAQAVALETNSTIDAILTGKASDTASEASRITAELAELDRKGTEAQTLQTALRTRIGAETERLEWDANPERAIADVVSNSEATVELVRRTRQAWIDAVAGAKAIKYLTDHRMLDHASLAKRAGTPPTHSIELLAYLTMNSEYKRILPDRTFEGMPSWAEAVRNLETDAMALLPGEKPAPRKTGSLFGK